MSKFKNTIKIIIGAIFIIAIAFGIWQNQRANRLKHELLIKDQNIEALYDSTRIRINRFNDLEYVTHAYISENNDLKKLNEELKAEVKKEKGRVYQLNRILVEIQNKPADTIYIDNTLIEYNDDIYGLEWEIDTFYTSIARRQLHGISKFKIDSSFIILDKGTYLINDEITFKLITGLQEYEKDKLEIFVRSDYPGFHVYDIEGSIIDVNKHPLLNKYKKPKKWSIGLGMYGGYDFVNQKPAIFIGAGIQRNIISF